MVVHQRVQVGNNVSKGYFLGTMGIGSPSNVELNLI